MLMNDPTREYYKPYEIDYDRHTYDGENWTYINLPAEDIKKMAIESIKDNAMMYFSCDVNKFFDRERGVLDTDNFDYSSLMGVDFGMNKADRIRTHASASSHLMTLVAVDLDAEGKPQKWMVETSWGNGPTTVILLLQTNGSTSIYVPSCGKPEIYTRRYPCNSTPGANNVAGMGSHVLTR